MIRKPVILAVFFITIMSIGCAGNVTPPPVSTVQPPQVTGTPSRAAWEVEWEGTIAAAKKEGQVMVYAIPGPEVRSALAQAFKSKFGIEVEFVAATGPELTRKLITERQAGLYLGDVILGGASTLVTSMKPEGLLAPMKPALLLPNVIDPRMWQGGVLPFLDKETSSMGLTSQYNAGLIRNTDMVKEGAVGSFMDLLKPEWKGKVVMFDPTVSGGGNNLMGAWVLGIWGADQTKEYLKGLVQQELILTRDPRLHVEWVARGKYPLGLGAWTDHMAAFMRDGAPILPVKMAEGGYVTSGPGGLALLNKPAHPAAATVFINWLLSQEGQAVFSKAFGSPSKRLDVSIADIHPSLILAAGEKAYFEDEEGILARGRLMTMAKEVMAPLFK